MAAYNLGKLRVLIIDDSQLMRNILAALLRGLGIKRVTTAESGADALEKMNNFEPDLIVCDWEMEPINGVEFTKVIRNPEGKYDPYVPIIMMSGHSSYDRVIMARDVGINEFLAKPVTAQNLYNRISFIIDNPREFIKTATYFGPDRRRRYCEDYMGDERRAEQKKRLELVRL